MFKKFIPTLLAAIMIVASTTIASVAQPIQDKDASNQYEAIKMYETLINSYKVKEKSLKSSVSAYPDYFGGAFINGDGKLVVYSTKESDTTKTNLRSVLGETSNNIIIKPCKYTYQELSSIIDELNDYKLSNPDSEVAKNFNQYALKDSDNSIEVLLDDYSDDQIELFKKEVCDSEAILFDKGGEAVDTATNVNAGDKCSSQRGWASVGYRVKKDGKVGIVTAAHFAQSNDNLAYNGSDFSKCVYRVNSGSVDAAFCEITDSNYAPTNTLSGTNNTLSTTISEPGVGTVINKIGAKTNQTSGKVTSTNSTITFSGVTFTNLTQADYKADYGDSGCPVYSYISSSNTRLTLGLHKGISTTNGVPDGKYSYFVKARLINSSLGTSRY